jgi:hypothetical protein
MTGDPSAKPWDKDTQAEYTRKMQRLADLERQLAEGRLLDKETYDNYLVKWAGEDPDAALEVFGNLKQHVLESQRSSGGTARGGIPAGGEFDDSILDQTSEAYQKFVQEHGQRGYRQAVMAKMAPELLEVAGINKEMAALRDFQKNYAAEREELLKRLEQAERYAISSFDQTQIAQDPRRQQIRDLQAKLKETNGEAWYEVIEAMNKLKELESKTPAAAAPVAPAVPDPTSQAPTPEQLAARINQTNVVPQGAGSGSGQMPSQALDPFDAAVLKHDPEVAQRLGITAAA